MSTTTTVSTATFKVLLGGLFDQVNDTIQQAVGEARNAGIELELKQERSWD